MKTSVSVIFIILTIGCLSSVFEGCNPGADPGWPQVNGPYGNFNPARYGCILANDLAEARKVWTSEDHDLGYAKIHSMALSPRAIWPGHPGSSSGLIFADGKIFASSFRPSGDIWAETELTPEIQAELSPAQINRLKQNLRIDADDIVIAIDASSGKTVWKAVEENRGLCRGMRKFGGWAVTPAYYDGKVFNMGTTGRLYAYDALTGGKMWETDIGLTHQKWEAEKQQHLKEKTLPTGTQRISLIVADGVLVVPIFDNKPDTSLQGEDLQTALQRDPSLIDALNGRQDISLRGVNPDNGEKLWELAEATAQYATPAVWRHKNREYVLAATYGDPARRTGRLRLISPRDGKVMWTVDSLANTHFSLAPSDKTVLVNIGSKTPGYSLSLNRTPVANSYPWMLLAAYRLSETGAERIWTMPDEPDFWHEGVYDASDWRKYLIRDGKVYYSSRSRNPDNNIISVFFIFDEDSGKVLKRIKIEGEKDHRYSPLAPGESQIYLTEDRILHVPNASHGAELTLQLWNADPQNFRRLCPQWIPLHTPTSAYEVFLEFPYVNGRIYMRTQEGSVVCYDLRQPSGVQRLALSFNDPYAGRQDSQPPLKAVLLISDGKPCYGYVVPDAGTSIHPPDEGTRRNIVADSAVFTDNGLKGMLKIDVGFHTEIWSLELSRSDSGFTGTYARRIGQLEDTYEVKGKLGGTVQQAPGGATTWMLKLTGASDRNLTNEKPVEQFLLLDLTAGKKWLCNTRSSTVDMMYDEVDASQLIAGNDRLYGEITVIFHGRKPTQLHPDWPEPVVTRYRIDAGVKGETITGQFEGVIGREWSRPGTVTAAYMKNQLKPWKQ